MSREILTPFSHSAAVELSGSGRPRYRKQIMKIETIRYPTPQGERIIRFDRAYLQKLVEAFNSGAYDQVPFQIADAQNSHNNDPERTRGDLVGVELTEDGIDGIFEPTPEGEAILRANPKLGVSCRIVENSNGEFPLAIQHVLGTVNPKLRGMRPWEKVDLAAEPVDQSTDLSMRYEEENMPEGMRTLELSDSDYDRLRELLDDSAAADQIAELIEAEAQPGDPDYDPDQDDDPTDDNEDEESEDQEETGVPNEQVALLMARQDANEQRIIELTNQLRTNNVRHELDTLARQGLAPAIIKAAQPMLGVPTGAIELSQPDGSRVDPAETMRQVLSTVLELAQSGQVVVDLDAETGFSGPEVDSDVARRQAMVDQLDRIYGH